MSTGEVVAIAAVARNGVIGAGLEIPWRIPGEQARFKAITWGHTLVMGRKTYDSIGRPLPGRRTIVVTRNPQWQRDQVSMAPSVAEALAQARKVAPEGTTFVAGGGEIYRAAWEMVDRLEITEVDQGPVGEVTFPSIDPATWVLSSRVDHDGFAFVSYRRRDR